MLVIFVRTVSGLPAFHKLLMYICRTQHISKYAQKCLGVLWDRPSMKDCSGPILDHLDPNRLTNNYIITNHIITPHSYAAPWAHEKWYPTPVVKLSGTLSTWEVVPNPSHKKLSFLTDFFGSVGNWAQNLDGFFFRGKYKDYQGVCKQRTHAMHACEAGGVQWPVVPLKMLYMRGSILDSPRWTNKFETCNSKA